MFKQSTALFLLGIGLLLGGAGRAQAAEEKLLNIYNWSDYIAEDTIRNFEKETGIQVRYDTFDNNEIVHAKMVAGDTGYDLVVPSSYWAKIQADGGLLRKIDKGQLPRYGNLDPVLQAQLAKLDPGNQYMVTWLWGFSTVGINVDKVRAAIAPLPLPENSWELLFNPRYISRLKSCGVSFMDSATEVIPAALHYLGLPPYSRSTADYHALPPLLKSIRPYVTLFSSSGYINSLANGSICVVLGWSGDINIARQRAIAGKTGQRIQALLPSTGGILFMDTLVIPADAPHPGNALKFIDYILRPEVAAAISSKVFYSSPNRAARALIRPEIANDPTVYPSDAEMARMIAPGALANETRRQMTHLFTAFKSGY
ncbi:extracellular solute-binding protein [Roseateles saccharophilus]|nr:extracellular solute-binding protein [Roseateles saccharophilus]MDG0832909.1 extracellular solute-binding protein [Roseateles saccharophilus]